MKITYYGTAAGEAWPGVFCRCELCERARALGGKNIRTRSQALVNDDLLLDLPPENHMHSLLYGLDLSRVEALLFTHSHSDHCYPEDLELLREPYSHTRTGLLEVYGNTAVERRLLETGVSLGGEVERFRFHRIQPNDAFSVLGYRVLALRATHTRTEPCLFYRIEKDGKSILYAHDTGALSEENMEMLASAPGKLSLVSLDCTAQKHRDGAYHMGFYDDVEQKERLIKAGLADEETVWVVNHFSHNGGWLHEELAAEAEKYGFLASYDGMTVEF